MKKALIDPSISVTYIASWFESNGKYEPIYSVCQNSARVCEICEESFEVANPLFWVDCSDEIVADQFWYDVLSQKFNPIENAPYPQVELNNQPQTTGTQEL